MRSAVHDVLLRWLPPSDAPRGGSLTINMIPSTHSKPMPGVTWKVHKVKIWMDPLRKSCFTGYQFKRFESRRIDSFSLTLSCHFQRILSLFIYYVTQEFNSEMTEMTKYSLILTLRAHCHAPIALATFDPTMYPKPLKKRKDNTYDKWLQYKYMHRF